MTSHTEGVRPQTLLTSVSIKEAAQSEICMQKEDAVTDFLYQDVDLGFRNDADA